MDNIIKKDFFSRLGSGTLYGLNHLGIFNLDSENEHPSGAYEPLEVSDILLGSKDKLPEVELDSVKSNWGIGFIGIDEVSPYLYPISYLNTPEILIRIHNEVYDCKTENIKSFYNAIIRDLVRIGLEVDTDYGIVEFCLENHIDIYGLIKKDLAIEVTEENNPYKK